MADFCSSAIAPGIALPPASMQSCKICTSTIHGGRMYKCRGRRTTYMDEVQDAYMDVGGRQRREQVVEAQVPQIQGYIRAAVLVPRKAWKLRVAAQERQVHEGG